MARTDLEELLPPGSVSNTSRAEVLRLLAVESLAVTGIGAHDGMTTGISEIGPASMKDVTEQLSALSQQLGGLAWVQQTQINATQDNTQAVVQNTATRGTGGSSLANTVSAITSSALSGGLALSPLITGLMSLFGGSGNELTAAPAPFKLPNPIQYEAGLTGRPNGQLLPVDYGQAGQIRVQNSMPPVTVQVNAMDSKSFLDHSDEIAQAVKQAILNSSSLNDVIADL